MTVKIKQKKLDALLEGQTVDERILELTDFLADVSLPFSSADQYEYWLLDAKDQSPLALIFSAKDPEQMNAYPSRPEWTALPAAVMPIEITEEEKSYAAAPGKLSLRKISSRKSWGLIQRLSGSREVQVKNNGFQLLC